MTIEEIKAAVKAGLTVHWINARYIVEVDKFDQWFITWNKGGRDENSVGLMHCDEKGNPLPEQAIKDGENFYIAK